MKKVLAFDIGGTNTRLALINEHFKIEKQLVTPTPFGDEEKFIQNCVDMISQFPLENVVRIGVAVPGLVDDKNGIIISLVNVGIYNVKFSEKIENKFNIPVNLINDASAGAIGEAYIGVGKRYDRVFFLTISTGIGGAFCIDKILQNYPVEVGHTLFQFNDQIIEYEMASGRNIPQLAKMCGFEFENCKDFFEKYKDGKDDASQFFDIWIGILNQFINLLENSYAPDIFVLTGGVMKSRDLFFDKLQKNHHTPLKLCKFGENAGLIGTGVFAMQCAKII